MDHSNLANAANISSPAEAAPSPTIAVATPPPQSTLIAVCLLVIATILLATALSYTRSMMIPFVFSLFLSYFVSPWVGFFKRYLRFPHWLAVMGAMGLLVAIISFFGMILSGSVNRLIDSFYLYEVRLAEILQMATDFLASFDVKLDKATILSHVRDLSVFGYLQSAAGLAMTFVVDFMLVMVFLIFLVSGQATGEKKIGIGAEINDKVRGYIFTKILTNLLTALCVWIIYLALGLDLSLLFATLCFLLGFIPTLGCVIATLLPLPIALIQYQDPWPIWAVLVFPAIIQILIGNILEPKLLGRGLDLHPITILLSLMFWGLIWGVAGMFLAVPITAVMKIVLDKHPLTHHFSEVLAGRSPI
jgi:AI-2 transport protein TqsA